MSRHGATSVRVDNAVKKEFIRLKSLSTSSAQDAAIYAATQPSQAAAQPAKSLAMGVAGANMRSSSVERGKPSAAAAAKSAGAGARPAARRFD